METTEWSRLLASRDHPCGLFFLYMNALFSWIHYFTIFSNTTSRAIQYIQSTIYNTLHVYILLCEEVSTFSHVGKREKIYICLHTPKPITLHWCQITATAMKCSLKNATNVGFKTCSLINFAQGR